MIEMGIKESGMKAAQDAVKMIEKFGTRVYGAKLLDTMRLDSDKTNVEIIEFLTETNRDMFSLGRDEAKTLQFFADKIIRGIDMAMRKGGQEAVERKATVIMSRSSRDALKHHIKKAVIPRIKDNMIADGGTAAPVTPEYSGYRAAKFGIPDDPTQVGEASGQLLEAIANGDIKALIGR